MTGGCQGSRLLHPKHREKNKSWHLLVYDVWHLLLIIWACWLMLTRKQERNSVSGEAFKGKPSVTIKKRWTKKPNIFRFGYFMTPTLEPNKTKHLRMISNA